MQTTTSNHNAAREAMQGATFPITIMAQSYGNWSLGYAWVDVSIGGAMTTGLALYARQSMKEPSRRVVGSIKEAMSWFVKCRIPARAAGKFMAAISAAETARWLGFETPRLTLPPKTVFSDTRIRA